MTAVDDTKEVKKENFATVEEALEGAGSRVLAHLGHRAHILTQQEVKEHDEESNPPEQYAVYGGPYTDLEDERNAWTYKQEAKEISATKDRVEAYEAVLKAQAEGEEDGDEDEDEDSEEARRQREAQNRDRDA